MPTDACLWFYECQGCHSLLKPKTGDCCVFCSYGSVACPPVQLHGKHSGCCGGWAGLSFATDAIQTQGKSVLQRSWHFRHSKKSWASVSPTETLAVMDFRLAGIKR